MKQNITTLIQRLPNLESGSRFILGVDGLSRSGKTTFVKSLSMKLEEQSTQFCIFHMDDYIVERKKRYNTGHEEWFEYYSLQWDIDWLKHNFFVKLKGSDQLTLPFYDPQTDTHGHKNIILPKTCLIIIEGVFLHRREWRDYFDYSVYLDCPWDKRFLRESEQTQKNMAKFENRYWKAEEYYLKLEDPENGADLVLEG
ncbi:uridine kinase [Bacillus pakistanensis]|uniref:Uridine kinase n=1 Tax=Rossellomorea pakistanensis TaxID=992288 RepID=A0ABS2ND57_9BACI|nr:kinase [Bacillus pakistanensis]MBM7585792.1 uridine kinase [Bacillus pakistanensis]